MSAEALKRANPELTLSAFSRAILRAGRAGNANDEHVHVRSFRSYAIACEVCVVRMLLCVVQRVRSVCVCVCVCVGVCPASCMCDMWCPVCAVMCAEPTDVLGGPCTYVRARGSNRSTRDRAAARGLPKRKGKIHKARAHEETPGHAPAPRPHAQQPARPPQ